MSIIRWIRKKWRKIYLKIVREKASPEYVARGWSIGMFYGCLIPIGGQLLFSIPTAFALKGSKVGAVLGTFITNQITIFFIYPAQCWLGAKLLGVDLSYGDIKIKLKDLMEASTLLEFRDALLKLAGELSISFLVGGAIMAAVLTPFTYFAVKKMVIAYRIRVEIRRRKRLSALRARAQVKHQRAKKMPGEA